MRYVSMAQLLLLAALAVATPHRVRRNKPQCRAKKQVPAQVLQAITTPSTADTALTTMTVESTSLPITPSSASPDASSSDVPIIPEYADQTSVIPTLDTTDLDLLSSSIGGVSSTSSTTVMHPTASTSTLTTTLSSAVHEVVEPMSTSATLTESSSSTTVSSSSTTTSPRSVVPAASTIIQDHTSIAASATPITESSTTATSSSSTSSASATTAIGANTADQSATSTTGTEIAEKTAEVKPVIPESGDPQATVSANRISTPTPARDDKHVFAHFMLGIVATYTAVDWERDMALAQAAGISGFALNTGRDEHTPAQLDLAYAAANKLEGFYLFISFDFNKGIFELSDHAKVADVLRRTMGNKSQFKMDGKPFVSTFVGDGFAWSAVSALLDNTKLFAVPFNEPAMAGQADVQGLFSWSAWPGQIGNKPIQEELGSTRDNDYLSVLTNKAYMAPVSPWFFTHFEPSSYNKNWVFYSELLWKTRWDRILTMGVENGVNLVEIISWNDYGESHHVGPYGTGHTDDGSSKWNVGLEHTAMLDMAVPYIAAFRAGLKEPIITQDMVVYWYRPHLKGAVCIQTDNCGKEPDGASFQEDAVFITVLSKNGGTLTVTSGSNAPVTEKFEAGAKEYSVPMGVGKQNFKFTPTGGEAKESTSKVDISDQCRNGIYNFNFHAGSLKF